MTESLDAGGTQAQPGPDAGLPQDVTVLSYEEARDELTTLVRRLETGQAPLEEALAMWERGEQLARHCEDVLNGALARLNGGDGQSGSLSA
jgi:exodeoxyribonuclease VII small subunit